MTGAEGDYIEHRTFGKASQEQLQGYSRVIERQQGTTTFVSTTSSFIDGLDTYHSWLIPFVSLCASNLITRKEPINKPMKKEQRKENEKGNEKVFEKRE